MADFTYDPRHGMRDELAGMSAEERIQHNLNSRFQKDDRTDPGAAIRDWHSPRVSEFGPQLAGLLATGGV